MKRVNQEINGYVNGELIAKHLIAFALKKNKLVDDVKKEMREHFPTIEFKVEAEK